MPLPEEHTIIIRLDIKACETCGADRVAESTENQDVFLIYCPNYRCPESPNFRRYLLGEYQPPIGKWTSITEDEMGLHAEGKLNNLGKIRMKNYMDNM